MHPWRLSEHGEGWKSEGQRCLGGWGETELEETSRHPRRRAELEGGRQDVAGPGQGREEEAGAGARHAGGGAATGAGMRAEARFSHRPSRPGRQAEQGRPCFTQEQFLHLPERLQRQQAMVGDIWNVRRQ